MSNRELRVVGRLLRYPAVVAIVACVGICMIGAGAAKAEEANPLVIMETTKGTITIELYPEEAPATVENFLWYVDNEFYDGLIFHRVIPNFMIQGGGFTKDLVKKSSNPAIKNEASNGLKNNRGTLAMARTPDPNSATCQFFINLKDNDFLNYTGPDNYGYAVFGAVIEGMDAVDAIAAVKTVTKDGYKDVPATPVVINKAYRKDAQATKKTEKDADKASMED
jgi:peptidyl-prolyl cis-trans isomerase A (cyclophilin A)